MVKVLIGNKDIQKDINNFQFLKDNNEYEIITSNSGIETINKCKTISPEIIIINSNFLDMAYTEVIDKISNLPSEYDKCNLILTVDNPSDKMLLRNTSIIYRVFDTPFNEIDEKKAEETINSLKVKFETPNLTLKELRTILLKLGINTYSNGSQYLISAIFKCYYYPEKFTTLDNIYKIVADEYDVSKEQVKDAIRHTIDTLNTSYNTDSNNLYLKIFESSQNISSKVFLQKFVDYLHIIKSKN